MVFQLTFRSGINRNIYFADRDRRSGLSRDNYWYGFNILMVEHCAFKSVSVNTHLASKLFLCDLIVYTYNFAYNCFCLT